MTRATQRNEQAITHWKTSHWPQIKKAQQENRTIVFVDEAGFYLLPMVVRTYAPRGQTPILRVALTRDHLSAIGGITPTGRLFMQMQTRSYKAEDVVRFLEMLTRKIPGNLLIVWDGSPIHRADVIKQFLSSPAGKRIHLERLPGYAPELIPRNMSGTYSSAANSKISVAEIWFICERNLSEGKSVSVIARTAFSIALPLLWKRFSSFSRGQ